MNSRLWFVFVVFFYLIPQSAFSQEIETAIFRCTFWTSSSPLGPSRVLDKYSNSGQLQPFEITPPYTPAYNFVGNPLTISPISFAPRIMTVAMNGKKYELSHHLTALVTKGGDRSDSTRWGVCNITSQLTYTEVTENSTTSVGVVHASTGSQKAIKPNLYSCQQLTLASGESVEINAAHLSLPGGELLQSSCAVVFGKKGRRGES